MAVTIKGYSNFPVNLLKQLFSDINAAGSDVRVALCTSTYTPNQETHNDFADITNEVSGDGYTAHGVALANKAVTEATRVTTFDADNASWADSTITARYAIIYDYETAVDATSPLIAYVDFGEDKSSENGTFEIQWDAGGIFTITVPA